MKILLDNGHGNNTPGKRSPDGRLMEWAFARELTQRIARCLHCKGYDVERITPEDCDVPLSVRCRRVNHICNQLGKQNVLLVSIHCDAAGNGSQWFDARGFSARVGERTSAKSKALAQYLWNEALAQGMKGNRAVPANRYVQQNLMICQATNCPAVLTENLFMDNRDDVETMLSEEGKQKLTDIHVNAIVNFIEDYCKN